MRERARKGAREKRGAKGRNRSEGGEMALLTLSVGRREAGRSGQPTNYNGNATVLLSSKSELHTSTDQFYADVESAL